MLRPHAIALAFLLSLLGGPAAAQTPAQIVRVHAHAADNEARVRVVSVGPSGASCASATPTDPARERWGDCVVDIPAGSQLSITLGDHAEAPRAYWVPEDRGSELDLKVVTGGDGAITGGATMMVGGGLFALIGGLVAAAASDSPCHCYGSTAAIAGAVTAVGAAVFIGGIVLIGTRSREPDIETLPRRRATESHGRKADFLGDVAASARSREPSTTVPSAFTPLGYSFTF